MEEFFKFLVIAAVVVIAIVRQVKKEAQKKTPKKPVVPPREAVPPLSSATEEDGTYNGYIPEGPASAATPAPQPRNPLHAEGQRTTRERQSQKSGKATTPQGEAGEDFRIRSAEEARRAIIWGEILTRKY